MALHPSRARPIADAVGAPWTRKHDLPGTGVEGARRVYPTSLEDLIEICAQHAAGTHLKAAGSHWALSDAAISDDLFIETHDPDDVYPAMGRTLYEVVPGCLNEAFVAGMARARPPVFGGHLDPLNDAYYLVHVETGKRVYQLYAELDHGDDDRRDSLANHLDEQYGNDGYHGPWAFRTLGGAGGQTVFGALTTGTHGGDFCLPPIADDVAALHLVADGGRHYWIEPRIQPGGADAQLTDDARLRATYGNGRYGPPENFEIVRDDNLFNAVLISAGRFGVVYSIVLRAVRQYSLHEERRLETWEEIRGLVGDPTSTLYSTGPDDPNRFLQIAVCPIPHGNFQQHLAGVTRRWNAAPAPNKNFPNGRAERVGGIVDAFDERIGGPRFRFAGNSHVYSPDPDDPDAAAPVSLLERACANPNLIEGAIKAACDEIREFLENHKVLAGSAFAAVVAIGAAEALLALATSLAVILALLLALLDALRGPGGGPRLGEVMGELAERLLNRPLPGERAAGLFAWQLIAYAAFSDAQQDLDYNAISYAVMDRHDYHDESCNVNADAIEVFFDATDPMLVAFVDAVLAYEIRQETRGKTFVGYLSLRFTAETRASLGPERWPHTCVVEIAGLKDVDGVTELIDYAIALSRDPNFGGILHWGQRNPSNAADIAFRFGAGGDLAIWRAELSWITEDGRLDAFSSAFTRQTGLEPS